MRKAFTLIELLVVIAIIAILAAILFPVFAQAKAAAKKTQALSNVKQLSTASALYIQDTDGVYFEHAQGLSTGDQTATSLIWNGLLQPYAKSVSLAIDPASNISITPSFEGINYTGMYWTKVDRKPLSTGYNGMFTSQYGYACSTDMSASGAACKAFYSESALPYNSSTLLFVSSVARNPGDLGSGYYAAPNHDVNTDSGISDRHNKTSVVSFADTHAKASQSRSLLVADQIVELNPSASGQCVNYNSAKVVWDPSAPNANDTPLCEGKGIR